MLSGLVRTRRRPRSRRRTAAFPPAVPRTIASGTGSWRDYHPMHQTCSSRPSPMGAGEASNQRKLRLKVQRRVRRSRRCREGQQLWRVRCPASTRSGGRHSLAALAPAPPISLCQRPITAKGSVSTSARGCSTSARGCGGRRLRGDDRVGSSERSGTAAVRRAGHGARKGSSVKLRRRAACSRMPQRSRQWHPAGSALAAEACCVVRNRKCGIVAGAASPPQAPKRYRHRSPEQTSTADASSSDVVQKRSLRLGAADAAAATAFPPVVAGRNSCPRALYLYRPSLAVSQ